MKHVITHTEFTNDYFAGYETAKLEIKQMGFDSARNKFNLENPIGVKPSSMAAYYYAKGQIQAFVEQM